MKSQPLTIIAAAIIGAGFLGALSTSANAGTPSWASTETRAFAPNGAVSTGAALSNEPVSVTVSLKLRNRAQLEGVAQAVASSVVPPITHEEFLATYAPTEAQAYAVASYLSSMGYSNVTIDDNRLLVSGDGTAGTAAAAFNTSLAHFTRNGGSGIANVTDRQR
jgi:pseudomonalisin